MRTFLLVALPLTAAAAFAVHWLQSSHADPALAWPDDARREVQALVENRYVDTITAERSDELFDAAMRGYVGELDPFSRYFSASERPALEEDTTGRFEGIGVRVDPAPSGLLVVAVRKDGPADVAGIIPGETIERVGSEPLAGRDRETMIDLIRGPSGTKVELGLRPAGGGELRRVEAVRGRVDQGTVTAARTVAGATPIGYLRIAQFADTTGAEVREALKSIAEAHPAGVVLDLRHDLGGVVQAAVEVASAFLPQGAGVCVARYRNAVREYRADPKEGFQLLDVPLVVLVDESTASASEILAGALQDHGRAVLVGDRTYGKFVMQTIVPLAKRGAAVRITTARYETPRGRSDQRDPVHGLLGGLLPDVRVPLASADEQKKVETAFARQAGPAWRVLAGRDGSSDAPDTQLAAALGLLRGQPAPAEPVPPRTN
jgi:carboxyl-terminal processing protease